MAFTIGDIVANAFDSNTPGLGRFREIGKTTNTVVTEAIVETPKVSNDAPIIVEEAKVEVVPSVNGIPVLDLKPVNGSANYTELKTPPPAEPIPLDTGKVIPTSMPTIRRFEDTLIISDDKKAYLSNYFSFGPGRIFDQEHGLTLKNAYEILCLRLQTEKSVYDAFAKFINSFNPSADPAKKISAHGIEPYEFVIFMYKDNEHEYIIKVHTGKDIDFKKDNNGVVVGSNNAIQFIIK